MPATWEPCCAPSVAGDAVVGEKVGRVGEDEVDGLGGHFGEELERVALIDADVVARVVEDGSGKFCGGVTGLGRGFGHDSAAAEANIVLPADQLGSLIKWETESSGGETWVAEKVDGNCRVFGPRKLVLRRRSDAGV